MIYRRKYAITWTGECKLTCDRCGAKWTAVCTLALPKTPDRAPRLRGRCDRCIEAGAAPTLLESYRRANGGKL